MKFKLNILPPDVDVETKEILKQAAKANRHLAELKGLSASMPNQKILINTLSLQEAKDSSEIENIVTTQDELYKSELESEAIANAASKEVKNYAQTLIKGFEQIKSSGLLTNNDIILIQSMLEHNNAGFRKVPGTGLRNTSTGELVYEPPQSLDEINKLMNNLELFINDDTFFDTDPLIKMAMIHYQFESIHPFYDGNGRTGRIICVLYLVLKDLLDIPVLYLSRHIIRNKEQYYNLLQKVHTENAWEEWILYMLTAIEKTSIATISLVEGIKRIMMDYKHRIRKNYPFYSQDLINNLFFHPYTKIDFLKKDLKISRHTAGKYLDQLTEDGFLEKRKLGRTNYYINVPLFKLLMSEGDRNIE